MVHSPTKARTTATAVAVSCLWLDGVTGSLEWANGTNESMIGVWLDRGTMGKFGALVFIRDQYMRYRLG